MPDFTVHKREGGGFDVEAGIVDRLRRWGHATVNRYAFSRGDRAIHALEAIRDLAPGTKERAERQLVGRDGGDRRRLMAAGAGVSGMHVTPMWAVDPIRASNDASPPMDCAEIAVDQGIPENLVDLDRAIGLLHRQSPLRALIVRIEFCEAGSQAVKAHKVREQGGAMLSVWQYRRELQRALDWLDGVAR